MMMQSSLTVSFTSPIIAMVETIKTRFGEITVDPTKALSFPYGLLGMPGKVNFVLSAFPSEKMQQFTLLQSLDDASLSFITLPLLMNNTIISEADLHGAARDLHIEEANLAMLLIVCVHRGEQVRLSVNARAPIFIDATRKLGVQYVFPNDRYNVQHMLG